MMKKIVYVVGVLAILTTSIIINNKNQKVNVESGIFEQFDNVKNVKKITDTFYLFYNSKSTLGKPHSVLSISEAEGYSGPIKIGVNYDSEGNIIAVKVLSQTETPGFFRRVEKARFRDQYIGRNVQDVFELKKIPRGKGPFEKSETEGEINAVTGATISSNGINTAVLKANAQTCNLYFKDKFNADQSGVDIQYKDVVLIVLYLFAFMLTYSGLKILRKLRPVFHLLSVVVIGFLGKGLLSITNFNNLLLGNFPENQLYWYLIIGLFVFSILVLGRNIYFAHICPMGILQDYLGKLPVKKIKFKQRKFYQYPAAILTLAISVYAIVANQPGYFGHEIFSAIFNFNFKSILFYFALLNLILALFIKRFWCRFLCPVGVVGRFLQMLRTLFVRKR